MSVHDINDHMAYTHSCGSVHFNLLRSGRIECAGCGELLEHTVNYETKTYSDGTTATGPAPLPDLSPSEQDYPIEGVYQPGTLAAAYAASADECPKCGTDEWDRITNRVAPGEVFNRCARCGNAWEVQ